MAAKENMTESNLENLNVPDPSAVAGLRNTDEEKTVHLSQKALDEIISKSMGRAAKDVRAKLAETEAKLQTAEDALKAASPNSTEVERLTAQLRLAEAEVNAVKNSAAEAAKTTDIERAMAKADIIDPAIFRAAVADRVQRKADGSYEILDDAGAVREGVSLQQFIDEQAAARPYLVKGRVISGTGQGGSTSNATIPQGIRVEQVFGPTSSSKIASEVMRRSPAEYARLKREAISRGIL